MKKRDDLTKDTPEAPEGGLSRRRFMGAAAIAGVAGATGLGSTIMTRESFAAAAQEAKNKIHIEPGELDEYYGFWSGRSEEHTSELQSRPHLVCRLLLEKKKKKTKNKH